MPNEKKRIILRVNRKFLEEKKQPTTHYLSKAENYTGLHKTTLERLKKPKELKVELDSIDRTLIYNTLCRFYVRNRADGGKLPTTYELFDALNKTGKLVHVDIGSFRKLLLKMGFIWKKLGTKSGRVVVIEKPQVRFERFNYLTAIRRSRIEKYDDVIFVGEASYNQEMFMDVKESRDFEIATGVWQQRMVYGVGVKTMICLKEVKEFNEAAFEDWIVTELCPSLSQPSVIVVENIDHHNAMLLETPSLCSTKTEIMEWLDHHDVTYDEDMTKYELYSIAEEYTDLETPLYKIDGILKARGHTLLRLPKCIEDLSPVALVNQMIKKNWNHKNGHLATVKCGQNLKIAKSVFSDIMLNAAKYLEGFTISVIANELKMISLEKDVDLNLDRLMMESTKSILHSNKYDSDVASCSDSE